MADRWWRRNPREVLLTDPALVLPKYVEWLGRYIASGGEPTHYHNYPFKQVSSGYQRGGTVTLDHTSPSIVVTDRNTEVVRAPDDDEYPLPVTVLRYEDALPKEIDTPEGPAKLDPPLTTVPERRHRMVAVFSDPEFDAVLKPEHHQERRNQIAADRLLAENGDFPFGDPPDREDVESAQLADADVELLTSATFKDAVRLPSGLVISGETATELRRQLLATNPEPADERTARDFQAALGTRESPAVADAAGATRPAKPAEESTVATHTDPRRHGKSREL
ncbi:hypothetical protein AB0E69_34120 [Kribbella sp. NPDC026611]|uniref:hypothetical protein n=1 Tax=Kribbella sp. NPDC026611 TaxID=3154911 RepID=UPI0033EF2743